MSQLVEIDYTKWRGERSKRIIEPIHVSFLSTEWHPERQWVLTAMDRAKHATRQFAMKDIHSWKPVSE